MRLPASPSEDAQARLSTSGRRSRYDARLSSTATWLPGRRSTVIPFDGAVHPRSGDADEVAELRDAVFASAVQGDEVSLLAGVQLRLLPRSRPWALATRIPSRVRKRIRSPSNSATMARTLNGDAPVGVLLRSHPSQ